MEKELNSGKTEDKSLVKKNKIKNIYIIVLLGVFLSFLILSWIGYFAYLRYAAANVSKIRFLPPLVFYLFAFFAGIVSFFAPCAIGILPAYLSYYLNIKEVGNKKAVYYGSFAAAGLISFYLVIGVLTIIFGQIIGMTLMTFNREISVVILLLVGLALLFNVTIDLRRFFPFLYKKEVSDITKSKSHEKGVFFFGIFYGIEAFMCALLLMVPLIIYPILGGDLLTSIISFIVFSIALGLSMILATVLISKSRKILTEKFMTSTLILKRIAGVVILLTAIFIIYTIITLPSMNMTGMSMDDGMDMENMQGEMDMGNQMVGMEMEKKNEMMDGNEMGHGGENET
tara:strand:- start:613 stop:1638 length:1026 start_codon:yes stop_codon:yes gene_type:complete